MTRFKIKNLKFKITIQNLKFLILICNFTFWILNFKFICLAQDPDLEFTLDVTSNTVSLPKIFKPNIDLSGRGFHKQASWPQTIAAKEVLDTWQKDIGFNGLYRIQYNLWEIHNLAKHSELQNRLLSNYDYIMKTITDSGGTVILDIFGMPSGLGKVLDKKSPPRDLKVFKELVKSTIRDLSCNKRYNIWYEVWSAPDLDDFFLGRIQEYLNLYRIIAESINELRNETKLHIPLGGPSVSWWFQNLDGNTVMNPERSLIYELIKFCYHYRLPLDFITWHGYSTDPGAEKENTIYKKSSVNLIRDWLSYFRFDKNIPLIVDEWNYDRNANLLPERKEDSFICSSYILSRLKNMYEAGIDYQLYFSLEDFQNNKEGVVRNVGIFSFGQDNDEYKGAPKTIYNVFRMLTHLGNSMFAPKLNDEFVGLIATKEGERIAIVIYNYIDPELVINYLSKNIANLNGSERKTLLNIINTNKLEKVLLGKLDIAGLRATKKLKAILKKTQELNERAKKLKETERNIKIVIKNLHPVRNLEKKDGDSGISNGVKEDYQCLKYTIDSSCSLNCEFKPSEEKELSPATIYQETLALKPYSVVMLILNKKPKEVEAVNTAEEKTADYAP